MILNTYLIIINNIILITNILGPQRAQHDHPRRVGGREARGVAAEESFKKAKTSRTEKVRNSSELITT